MIIGLSSNLNAPKNRYFFYAQEGAKEERREREKKGRREGAKDRREGGKEEGGRL
jgi:hypothetical protein